GEVQEGDVLLARAAQGGRSLRPKPVTQAGEVHLQAAKSVTERAQVETAGPRPQLGRAREVPRFDEVRFLLDAPVAVLHEAAGRREEQSLVARGLLEQAFD